MHPIELDLMTNLYCEVSLLEDFLPFFFKFIFEPSRKKGILGKVCKPFVYIYNHIPLACIVRTACNHFLPFKLGGGGGGGRSLYMFKMTAYRRTSDPHPSALVAHAGPPSLI